MRGKSSHHLLGGVHLTENAYPPFGIAKFLACIECGSMVKATVHQLRDCFVGEVAQGMTDEELMRKLTAILDHSVHFNGRVFPLEDVKAEVGQAHHVPWLLKCYPDMYPTWFGKLDGRLMGKPGRGG